MKTIKLKEDELIEMIKNHLKEKKSVKEQSPENGGKDDNLINKLIDKLSSAESEYQVKGENMLIFNGIPVKILTDGIIEVGPHQYHVSDDVNNKLKKIINPLKEEIQSDDKPEPKTVEINDEEREFLNKLLTHPDLGFDTIEEEEIVKNLLEKLKED